MGRQKKGQRPYEPLLEFSLRKKPEGGKLLVPGQTKGLPDARARRECLVLVHGFNNTDSDAAEAYFGFRTRQTEIFGAPDVKKFDTYFGDTFWPGDADWWSFLDKVDFLIYPSSVHTSVNAGRELADLLWQMPNLERVDFIGHSLGCRVILETLVLLRRRTLPMIGRVVLMAAAVPSEMLELRGRFYDLLLELAAERIPIRVLNSKQDPVLHYAFPPGQSLAGASEASDRALGRYGPTPRMPGLEPPSAANEITGAKHGDYWGHSKTDPSRKATENAGRFLSLGDIAREVGVARGVGVASDLPAPRDLAVTRRLGDL
jgi:pimeloyl-ACP methyl ester carboxylesterase